MHDTVTARLALSRRVVDVVIIVGAAAAASAAIALWYDRSLTIVVTCAAILVALLMRYHEPRDLVGLVVGATVGNAVELACDATGIWQHADRAVLNLAPAYILLCYPILGLATPRMIDALEGGGRSRRELAGSVAPLAAGLLLLFVVLSMQFGRDASMQSLVCAVCLTLTLWRFHSRHDLITAFAGALIALAWEVPATIAGAWSFPTPQVFGLLPAWLPAAYAVFFVTMGRLTAVLADEMVTALRRWRALPWTTERRNDLAVVSLLIASSVVAVCLFFSTPLVCALAAAAVLAVALHRWHTRADVLIAFTGAAAGPMLEYAATNANLWIYPYTTVGHLPAWVFTLWPAFPVCLVRLTHTLWPPDDDMARRPALEAGMGLLILLIEIPLIASWGNTQPLATAGATAVMLLAAALVLRSPQATVMLTLSGVFGMLCEMPPIALGAWSYPASGPLGFPIWLPTGYALFGFGIVQLAQGMDGLLERRARLSATTVGQRQAYVNQGRPEHAITNRQPYGQTE